MDNSVNIFLKKFYICFSGLKFLANGPSQELAAFATFIGRIGSIC